MESKPESKPKARVRPIGEPRGKKSTVINMDDPNVDIKHEDIVRVNEILNERGKPGPKRKTPVFTDNEIRLIYSLSAAGIPDRMVLRCLHLTENIMSSKKKKDIERYKNIIIAIELARMDRLAQLSNTLYNKAINGDNTCLIFALKTQFAAYGWSENKKDDSALEVATSLVDLIRDLSVKDK